MKVAKGNCYRPCSAALVWKQSLSKEIKEEGDPCNITELLSTPDRDFLVRSNGDEVKVDSLRGKIVLILFGVLRREELQCASWHMGVLEAYNELLSMGKVIEVVFVAAYDDGIVNDKELFDETFSKMPCQWLAVPFRDSKTRYRVVKLFFRYDIYPRCVIVSAEGKILPFVTIKYFGKYGADLYPFTHERRKEMHEEYTAARAKMSLNALLGPDHVLSSEGEMVPISYLEGMVVGLYMFRSWERCNDDHKILLDTYRDLKSKGKRFEIVFVNIHFKGGYDTEEAFNQETKKMPWLSLPFKDKRCRKLWVTFARDPERTICKKNEVIIIGPDGVSDFYGLSVMAKYGSEAYPFTLDMALEVEKKMPRGPTLDSLIPIIP